MLQESYSHAGADMAARQLAELRVAGWQLLESLRGALAADGEALLSVEERAGFDAGIERLQGLLDSGDGDAIKAMTEQLGRQTESFAARRMDKSIREALTGVSLDSLDGEVSQ